MPTSAAGSKAAVLPEDAPGLRRSAPPQLAAGLTLIELLVVVALIAIASSAVVLSLRSGPSAALERDAQRLAALLEATRAQARASDARVLWLPQAEGFVLRGLAQQAQPAMHAWLSPETRVRNAAAVVLGPEPLIGPQSIELYALSQPGQRLWVISDGLRPFAVRSSPPQTTP